MLFRRDKSVGMSLPQEKVVHGVTIKKVPVGKYIQALKSMEDVPRILAEQCFPGMTIDAVLELLQHADSNTVAATVGKLLTALPEQVISALCDIVGLNYETVLDTYTPAELWDIGSAFWELNDLNDFFGNVWGLIKAKLLPTLITGSKNGSQ